MRRQHNNHLLSIKAIVDESSSCNQVSHCGAFVFGRNSIVLISAASFQWLIVGRSRARVKLRRSSQSQTLSVPKRIKIMIICKIVKRVLFSYLLGRAWKNIQKAREKLNCRTKRRTADGIFGREWKKSAPASNVLKLNKLFSSIARAVLYFQLALCFSFITDRDFNVHHNVAFGEWNVQQLWWSGGLTFALEHGCAFTSSCSHVPRH